jgi:phosphonate transport system substrate-binding protein
MFGFYRAFCDAVERALSVSITLQQAENDPLDDLPLVSGQIDLAFICGLPLVRFNRRESVSLTAIAAPVPVDPCNGGKPIYFADFIVKTNSHYHTLKDLIGSRFAYNDSGSNSGYHLPRYFLYTQGFPYSFFGQQVATGAHQHSIQWVIEGKADCAAIDSTVLAQFCRDLPEQATQIRVIASTDGCPIPPLVVSAALGGCILDIQAALTTPDEQLQTALLQAGMRGVAAVSTADYAVIRSMFDTVEAAGYPLARSS